MRPLKEKKEKDLEESCPTHLVLAISCDSPRHLGVHVLLIGATGAKLFGPDEIAERGGIVIGVETDEVARLGVASLDFL